LDYPCRVVVGTPLTRVYEDAEVGRVCGALSRNAALQCPAVVRLGEAGRSGCRSYRSLRAIACPPTWRWRYGHVQRSSLECCELNRVDLSDRRRPVREGVPVMQDAAADQDGRDH